MREGSSKAIGNSQDALKQLAGHDGGTERLNCHRDEPLQPVVLVAQC
jgi:hypothetical protein